MKETQVKMRDARLPRKLRGSCDKKFQAKNIRRKTTKKKTQLIVYNRGGF